MSETGKAAIGFDPKVFTEDHGLRSVGLYWNKEIGGYYTYAHSDDDIFQGNGKTIQEAIAETEKAIAKGRANADQARAERIAKLKTELAKLEASAIKATEPQP